MSAHEDLARLRKVCAVLSLVPHGDTRADVESYANALELMGPEKRKELARLAGVIELSEESWKELVRAARIRFPNSLLVAAWRK